MFFGKVKNTMTMHSHHLKNTIALYSKFNFHHQYHQIRVSTLNKIPLKWRVF